MGCFWHRTIHNVRAPKDPAYCTVWLILLCLSLRSDETFKVPGIQVLPSSSGPSTVPSSVPHIKAQKRRGYVSCWRKPGPVMLSYCLWSMAICFSYEQSRHKAGHFSGSTSGCFSSSLLTSPQPRTFPPSCCAHNMLVLFVTIRFIADAWVPL